MSFGYVPSDSAGLALMAKQLQHILPKSFRESHEYGDLEKDLESFAAILQHVVDYLPSHQGTTSAVGQWCIEQQMQEVYPKLRMALKKQFKVASQRPDSETSCFELPNSAKFRSNRTDPERIKQQLVETRAEFAGLTASLHVLMGAARSPTPVQSTLPHKPPIEALETLEPPAAKRTPTWPVCWTLIVLGAMLVFVSFAVGLYFSIAKDRIGDGFTLAGWITAVGTLGVHQYETSLTSVW